MASEEQQTPVQDCGFGTAELHFDEIVDTEPPSDAHLFESFRLNCTVNTETRNRRDHAGNVIVKGDGTEAEQEEADGRGSRSQSPGKVSCVLTNLPRPISKSNISGLSPLPVIKSLSNTIESSAAKAETSVGIVQQSALTAANLATYTLMNKKVPLPHIQRDDHPSRSRVSMTEFLERYKYEPYEQDDGEDTDFSDTGAVYGGSTSNESRLESFDADDTCQTLAIRYTNNSATRIDGTVSKRPTSQETVSTSKGAIPTVIAVDSTRKQKQWPVVAVTDHTLKPLDSQDASQIIYSDKANAFRYDGKVNTLSNEEKVKVQKERVKRIASMVIKENAIDTQMANISDLHRKLEAVNKNASAVSQLQNDDAERPTPPFLKLGHITGQLFMGQPHERNDANIDRLKKLSEALDDLNKPESEQKTTAVKVDSLRDKARSVKENNLKFERKLIELRNRVNESPTLYDQWSKFKKQMETSEANNGYVQPSPDAHSTASIHVPKERFRAMKNKVISQLNLRRYAMERSCRDWPKNTDEETEEMVINDRLPGMIDSDTAIIDKTWEANVKVEKTVDMPRLTRSSSALSGCSTPLGNVRAKLLQVHLDLMNKSKNNVMLATGQSWVEDTAEN